MECIRLAQPNMRCFISTRKKTNALLTAKGVNRLLDQFGRETTTLPHLSSIDSIPRSDCTYGALWLIANSPCRASLRLHAPFAKPCERRGAAPAGPIPSGDIRASTTYQPRTVLLNKCQAPSLPPYYLSLAGAPAQRRCCSSCIN
jgi:hypothetical protein